jgi:hypothetical protein
MKILNFLLIVLSFFYCCSDRNKISKDVERSNPSKSFITNTDSIASTKKRTDTVAIFSNKEIIGTWKERNYKEELTVKISPTKFIYKEHRESYVYRMDKDSIRLYFRETTISGKPYFIDDTLLIRSPEGEFKYIRTK